ncbi:MAG: xanthine dehydrogenase family protein subunit M [Alphaproteobacteria bacterium]|nr:MAG: xanthine dehydrogenase family protein subunit M [Alphaproteobacteria bacterium]
MKARNFRYIRPASLDHAYRILAENGDAVPIAGGQSLLATLNMRLSAPKLLVDIADLDELAGQSQAGGTVRLGALTRHRELLESELVKEHVPLLRRAASHIGHVAIRNRGTLGGSLAYADPAAELPACAVALGATLMLGSLNGEREVPAEHFFTGLFETDLQLGELIVAVKFQAMQSETKIGFAELARRHGDFALVGLAAVATMARDRIRNARLAYFGCVDRARLARSVAAAVEDLATPLADAAAFQAAIEADLTPDDAPGLRADTKLHLATVLTRRVLNSLSGRMTA